MAKPGVTEHDLKKLGDICNTICYHLTAHLSNIATGSGVAPPEQVAQIYQLAAQLPPPTADYWASLWRPRGAGAAAKPAAMPMAEGAERVPGKRLKWTPELEAELVRLVKDEHFRKERLGKDAMRGGSLNWTGIARHFGLQSGMVVKNKYHDVTGEPKEATASKKKKGEGEDDGDAEPSAKKIKAEEPAKPAAETPATGAAAEWSKAQGSELVKLVQQEEARKEAFGKKKLRWKRIAEHFDRHKKDCRKQYTKITGREAPEDED